ncbi:hypothetical protein HK103_003686 [Boothiomyces macroporosus]|uniref:C3H1-type domain-containing protein n=1 Tax=Boothiomyces macroporosus TaxID=261099 RepID=A0AAD5ULY7_9FUNG|nr:hypothetical protein HK103_003686 [Boothiomyces macroporosus]
MATRVPCKFFQEGRCRNGNSCKFLHESKPAATAKSAYDRDTVRTELESERPLWYLSSVGLAKYDVNVIKGTDLSQDEARWNAVLELKTTGQINNYITTINQMKLKMTSELQRVIQNPQLAVNEAGGSSASAFSTPTKSAFGNTSNITNSFGAKPTTFGGQTSAFGQTGFGNKTNSAFGTTGFGNTSAFSTPTKPTTSTTSAFGTTGFGGSNTSAFGGNSISAFGNGQASAFGGSKPISAFGANNTTGSTFGANNTTVSAFGGSNTTSAFGGNTNSAFGGNTNSAFGGNTNSAFGGNTAPSTFGNTPGNTTSAFGKNAGPGFGSNPAPAAFGGTNTAVNATTAFGQPNATAGNAFGSNTNSVPSQPTNTVPITNSSQPVQTLPANPINSSMTPEQIAAAFAAPRFEFGQIPEIPPT